jgi:hypothetical protein
MALKQISYPLPGDVEGEDPALVAPRVLEPFLRRLVGDGPVNLWRARAEVESALWACAGRLPEAAAPADALPPSAIPSVARGAQEDRVLAEIDQDGFAFARDPADAPFFNQRSRRSHRQQNLIDIALVEGRVCVRKRVRGLRLGARLWGDRPVRARDWMRRGLWASLGLYLYSEAAALLRLRDLPFVPKLRRIDFAERALYVDYVQGENLRNLAARAGAAVHDADLKADPGLSRLSAHDLERREVQLLDRAGGGDFRREISGMAREINARGVAPLDVKLGNFIRGARTGRLYCIDFEVSRLQSQPRWEADLATHHRLLEELFDLAAHGHRVF